MAENRTSKALASSFKSRNDNRGYISSRIPLPNNNINNKLRENLKNEAKLRNEIQKSIKDMVEKKKSADEIKKSLDKDEYKVYEQYFDKWIQAWIIKLNPDIKSVLTKGLNRNKEEQEILDEMENLNSEIYSLYKVLIKMQIRDEIQKREMWKKKEEMKNQEKMKKQKEEEEI